jgi:Raf kinase inhibitor-like YbhB/YbcL family protein
MVSHSRVTFTLLVLVAFASGCGPGSVEPTATGRSSAMDFQLTSSAFAEGGDIPSRHGCDGGDAPVPLAWSGTPDGTAELAVVMDDPDARGFVHWVVVGIPASADGLAESGLPAGAREGQNNFGRTGYGGPCPPSGSHRYVFTLYALSAPLQVSDAPSADEVRTAAAGVTLGEAQLGGTYTRNR